jgi:UDP-N-acetyl-D-mannosaminuronic acid dehydrogenase
MVQTSLPDRYALPETTISVFGLGKMGLPLAAVLAEAGATVRGVDVDEDIVSAINAGETPVDNEPGLSELVARHGGERLSATTDGPVAVSDADVHVVLVPTLVDEDRSPDLSAVLAAAADIRVGVEPGDLVVLESTVPPGTTAGLFANAVSSEEVTAGEDFALAHCPERTSSGRVIEDLTESYPKIVGGMTPAGTRLAASLYEQFNEPGVIEVADATAAEAVKVFEGVYRDVNIALANELALACEELGVDAWHVLDAANSQPYCNIHDPGCGVGGHCIPVYPHFLIDAVEADDLLRTARARNDGMPRHTVGVTDAALDTAGRSLADATVLLLGLTYRPGVAETRFAPGLDIVELFDERGASVTAHDPLLSDKAIERIGATPAETMTDWRGFDAVVLVTGHEAYDDIDVDARSRELRTPVLVDGRGFFDRERVPEDLTFVTLGDGQHAPDDL